MNRINHTRYHLLEITVWKTGTVVRLLLVLMCIFVACSTSPIKKAEDHFLSGIKYLNQAMWEQAGNEFRLATILNPYYQEAHEKYQHVEYFYFGHKEKVRAEYQKLLSQNPRSALFHYLFAQLSDNDSVKNAEMRTSISLDSAFTPAYRRLINTLVRQEKYTDTEDLLERGLLFSQNSPDLFLTKLYLLEKQGKIEERIKLLHDIIARFPESKKVALVYSNLAELVSDTVQKISLYLKAFELAEPEFRYSMGFDSFFDLYKESDSVQALAIARRYAYETAPIEDRRIQQTAWMSIYRFYLTKDTVKAIEIAREVYPLDIPNPDLFAYFGDAILKLNRDPALALKFFEKALTLNTPNNMYGTHAFGLFSCEGLRKLSLRQEAYYRLIYGKALLITGKASKSLEVLKGASGKNEQAEASVQYRMGQAYERLSRPTEAIQAYTSSLMISEDDSVRAALEHLASQETNMGIVVPEKKVKNIDSLIAQAQIAKSKPAPEFTLKDLNGMDVRLSGCRGKVVVLAFWATWCGPCIAELPHFQKLADTLKNRSDVVCIAISVDGDLGIVQKYLKKKMLEFTVLMEGSTRISTAYGVEGIPALFVIDPDGFIRYKHVGYDSDVNFERMMMREIGIILGKKMF